MSDVNVVEVRNLTSQPQTCVFKGRQHVLPPNQTMSYDSELAAKFLERCSPYVEAVVAAPVTTNTTKTVWVANVTGNPSLPKEIKRARYDKATRQIVMEMTENPNRQPRHVSRVIKGGHIQFETSGGLFMQKTGPEHVIAVPPRTRVELEAGIAEWFLNREMTTFGPKNACIRSRAPSPFEPSLAWDLDDMRAYLRLTDTTADLGPDEATVVKAAKARVDEIAAKATEDGKEYDDETRKADLKHEVAEGLRTAKAECMNMLYYRLVDPDYRLPTREEFNEFVYGSPDTELSDEALAEVLAKADSIEKDAKVKKSGRKVRAGV